ncbi:MAG: hypothetical protein ACPGF7_10600 [Pontibacterium sp.]
MNIENLLATYRAVFETDDGKLVLADLEKRFHLSASTFERGDPHYSAFLEGQRSVVLTIKSMMEERGTAENTED